MPNSAQTRALVRAVELAAANVGEGGRPYGAVILLGDEVLAEGVNTVHVSGDPTAHAETEAIRAACREHGAERLRGAVVYASGEPCVMCQAVSHGVGIAELVYALSSADGAAAGWPTSPEAERLHRAWTDAAAGYARHQRVPDAALPVERWVAAQPHDHSREGERR